MRSKKARTRYYVLYVREGKYLYRSAEDVFDAQEELNYLLGLKSNGITALGIYDPQDWSFDWAVDDSLQQEHMGPTLTLTEQLRNQWDK